MTTEPVAGVEGLIDAAFAMGAVQRKLEGVGYIADGHLSAVVGLAAHLRKPIIVEGPAGTGKTQLAKSVAQVYQRRLVRLQCYEGIDESKALYEWDYRKQLLWIQAAKDEDALATDEIFGLGAGIFDEQFLLTRPLLEAIRSETPTVLLIDEVDRVDAEAEALFLEMLAEQQVSVPELGLLTARHRPMVFLTSNGTRDLSEALRRRCLYLYLDFPSPEREREIIHRHVPQLSSSLTAELVELVSTLRELDLKKPPSISESIDLGQTLCLMGCAEIDESVASVALSILLKHKEDIRAATSALTHAGRR